MKSFVLLSHILFVGEIIAYCEGTEKNDIIVSKPLKSLKRQPARNDKKFINDIK